MPDDGFPQLLCQTACQHLNSWERGWGVSLVMLLWSRGLAEPAPEGLLTVPEVPAEQLRLAALALVVIVALLQADLSILGVGEGYAHHYHRPRIGVGEVQAL